MADTQPVFTSLPSAGTLKAVSPSGRYAVGVNSQKKIYTTPVESFVYDGQTGEQQWLTTYDKNNLSACGNFAAVTDAGLVVGTSKDPDCVISTTSGETTTQTPVFSAAVWKDGVKTLLGYGNFDTSAFSNKNQDGTFGLCISADGTMAGGYVQAGKDSKFGVKQYPCLWHHEAQGQWQMEELPLPEGYVRGQVVGISADGNTVVGQLVADKARFYSIDLAIWKDGAWMPLSIASMEGDETRVAKMNYGGLSPNGKFIAVAFSQNTIWVYDTQAGTYRKVKPMGYITKYGTMAVADNGDVAGVFDIMESINASYTRPFWYSYRQDVCVDLKYFAQVYTPGLDWGGMDLDYKNWTDVAPCAISADGATLFGNGSKTWMLYTGTHDTDLPMSPTGLALKSRALGQVILTWNSDKFQYAGMKLTKYNIYRDNKLLASVEPAAENNTYTDNGLQGGHHIYSVESVFEKTSGGTINSPLCEDVKIVLPFTYALPLYEDAESGSLDDNAWTGVVEYGDDTVILFQPSEKKGENYSYGLYTNSICAVPYSYYTMSRPIDATKEKNVTMNFLTCQGYMNRNDWDMTKDSLAVEITTDWGETWTPVEDWSLAEIGHMSWNMKEIDLSPFVAGKLFNVRFRLHGQAVAQFWIRIDNVKIGTKPELEPVEGLVGQLSDDRKSAALMWKNQDGAYQLNYTHEMSRGRLSVGNGGNELIGANLFLPEDLKMYDGKYLSAVTTCLNHFDLGQIDDIVATAVVYQDGKLVMEKELPNVYNEYITAVFDKPLKIDATKELKVGVRVTDYLAQQTPLLVHITNNNVTGKSDLFSEDGGKTWLTLYDNSEALGNEDYKRAVWDITADITDEPSYPEAPNEMPCSYNVFRNGELISEFALDPTATRFVDDSHSEGDRYTVVAYRHNGDRTAEGESLQLDGLSAVNPAVVSGVKVYRDAANCGIRLEGEFSRAFLVGIDGRVAATASDGFIPSAQLTCGVYVLKIEAGGTIATRKIILGK